MAILRGGGSGTRWLKLQGSKEEPAAAGTVTRGVFVQFEADSPSMNPAFDPQDVLTLEVNGEEAKIGCPTALGRVFRNNEVKPGTPLAITYEGLKVNLKNGKSFHSFEVATDDGDTSFPPPADPPAPVADAELAKRLADARARRAAR